MDSSTSAEQSMSEQQDTLNKVTSLDNSEPTTPLDDQTPIHTQESPVSIQNDAADQSIENESNATTIQTASQPELTVLETNTDISAVHNDATQDQTESASANTHILTTSNEITKENQVETTINLNDAPTKQEIESGSTLQLKETTQLEQQIIHDQTNVVSEKLTKNAEIQENQSIQHTQDILNPNTPLRHEGSAIKLEDTSDQKSILSQEDAAQKQRPVKGVRHAPHPIHHPIAHPTPRTHAKLTSSIRKANPATATASPPNLFRKSMTSSSMEVIGQSPTLFKQPLTFPPSRTLQKILSGKEKFVVPVIPIVSDGARTYTAPSTVHQGVHYIDLNEGFGAGVEKCSGFKGSKVIPPALCQGLYGFKKKNVVRLLTARQA